MADVEGQTLLPPQHPEDAAECGRAAAEEEEGCWQRPPFDAKLAKPGQCCYATGHVYAAPHVPDGLRVLSQAPILPDKGARRTLRARLGHGLDLLSQLGNAKAKLCEQVRHVGSEDPESLSPEELACPIMQEVFKYQSWPRRHEGESSQSWPSTTTCGPR